MKMEVVHKELGRRSQLQHFLCIHHKLGASCSYYSLVQAVEIMLNIICGLF